MRLAERAGLHDLLAQHLSVASPNAAVKAAGVITGMLQGVGKVGSPGEDEVDGSAWVSSLMS